MGCTLHSQYILRPRTLLWCTLTMKGHGAKDQLSSRGHFFFHYAVGCLWQTSHKSNTLHNGWQMLGCKRRRSTSEALVSVRAPP